MFYSHQNQVSSPKEVTFHPTSYNSFTKDHPPIQGQVRLPGNKYLCDPQLFVPRSRVGVCVQTNRQTEVFFQVLL